MDNTSSNPFQILSPLYSSQSATSCYQECPRRYLFNYRLYGTGIVPNFNSVPLLQGNVVHRGVQEIAISHIQRKGIVDINQVVEIVKEQYRVEVSKYPLANIKDEYQQSVFYEQLALAEALTRLWYLMEWPKILEFYNIIAIEQEILFPLGDVQYQVRPDLILQDKRNGAIVNYSLKTTKMYNDRTQKALGCQLQVSTEPYGTSIWLDQMKHNLIEVRENLSALLSLSPTTIAATINYLNKFSNLPSHSSTTRFCFLIKGNWEEENKGKGDWYTNSNLIYGYRKFTPSGIEYAPEFWFSNPTNPSGKGRLGKGWEKFKTWENNDVQEDTDIRGVKGWIDWLWQFHKETLEKYIVSEPEIYVNPKLQQSRVKQVEVLEDQARLGIKILSEQDLNSDKLNEAVDCLFPMNTGSCFFPSPCDYLTICPNGNDKYREHIANDPLNEEYGAYRKRESHHEPERVHFNKRVAEK